MPDCHNKTNFESRERAKERLYQSTAETSREKMKLRPVCSFINNLLCFFFVFVWQNCSGRVSMSDRLLTWSFEELCSSWLLRIVELLTLKSHMIMHRCIKQHMNIKFCTHPTGIMNSRKSQAHWPQQRFTHTHPSIHPLFLLLFILGVRRCWS